MSEQTIAAKNVVGNPELVSSETELFKYIKIGETEGKYMVEDFFRNPKISQLQISPDGKNLAYLSPHHRRMNIKVRGVHEKKPRRITTEFDRDINSFIWGNNSTILYVKDANGDENFSLYKVDIKDGKDPVNLTPYENIKIEIIDDLIYDDDHVLIAMNKDNPQLFDVYKLNISTGAHERIYKNNPQMPCSSWLTDHEGNLRIAIAVSGGTNSTILYKADEDSDFKEVIETSFKTSIQPLIFDFDNNDIIYVSSNLNRDKSVIIKFDLREGKEVGDVLFQHDEVDVSDLTYSKKEKEIITYNYYAERHNRNVINDKYTSFYEDLEQYFDGKEFRIVSHDKSENLYIIRSFSDVSLGAYYLFNKEKHNITLLYVLGEWLEEENMNKMIPISFNSSDGLKINGYLTLPKDIDEGQKIPMVVNPHGGPWVRDYWGFNPEVQLLSHHGYAVLQVNYRGSTGYGKDFWEASFKQWGQRMQQDLTEATEHIVKNYPIDENKIAIYGGSYGGYACLAGLCYSPETYACGIDYVGVSNLLTFLETIPPYWKPYLEMMYEMVGHPDKDRKMLEKYSPALNSDLIKVPLYVVQGAHDPRVNIDESDQIVASLKQNNIDTLYMVKYNEGHGFRNEENKIEFYNSLIGFLKYNLK